MRLSWAPSKRWVSPSPQLEDRITRPLAKDYFVSPEVNIRVAGYHSLRYFISGAVKEPGLYEMTSRTTLMELIAKAGGVVPDRGNVAYILRGSAEEVVEGKSINELITRRSPSRWTWKACSTGVI